MVKPTIPVVNSSSVAVAINCPIGIQGVSVVHAIASNVIERVPLVDGGRFHPFLAREQDEFTVL